MSSCPSKTYPLNADEAVSICATIEKESGLVIDPAKTDGRTETHGVTIDWHIQLNSITISIPAKPWIVPCSQIFGELDKLFSAPKN